MLISPRLAPLCLLVTSPCVTRASPGPPGALETRTPAPSEPCPREWQLARLPFDVQVRPRARGGAAPRSGQAVGGAAFGVRPRSRLLPLALVATCNMPAQCGSGTRRSLAPPEHAAAPPLLAVPFERRVPAAPPATVALQPQDGADPQPGRQEQSRPVPGADPPEAGTQAAAQAAGQRRRGRAAGTAAAPRQAFSQRRQARQHGRQAVGPQEGPQLAPHLLAALLAHAPRRQRLSRLHHPRRRSAATRRGARPAAAAARTAAGGG